MSVLSVKVSDAASFQLLTKNVQIFIVTAFPPPQLNLSKSRPTPWSSPSSVLRLRTSPSVLHIETITMTNFLLLFDAHLCNMRFIVFRYHSTWFSLKSQRMLYEFDESNHYVYRWGSFRFQARISFFSSSIDRLGTNSLPTNHSSFFSSFRLRNLKKLKLQFTEKYPLPSATLAFKFPFHRSIHYGSQSRSSTIKLGKM